MLIRESCPSLGSLPSDDAERGVFVIEGPWKRERPLNLLRRQFLQVAVGAAALPTSSRFAWAQAYPARPVRMIVPFGPGGNADVFGRIIAQKLSEQIGEQFYVENISGAGGNIGVGRAALAAPDGYTILVTPPSYVINPALYDKIPYDARKSSIR